MPAVLSVAVGFLAGASAFQAGANFAPRSSVSRSNVAMQVSEATVASPVALAKAADEARGLAIDSMFLYSWLHMAGFDLSMEEVANFRAKDSKTPGHPEFGWTPGVESTTGPLGQGIGNGVGMAAAAKFAGATLNTADHTIIDHTVVVLCGDGCLQEGVANEAAAFAGHEKLDNLIVMYDSNGITLDK